MERINRQTLSPFSAFTRTRTGDLSQTSQTAVPRNTPPVPADSGLAAREGLIGQASQAEYGELPWAETPRMPPEQRRAVIDSHKEAPCQIGQASPYTCAATTIQRWLACNGKASYERMVNELAATETTKLPNGDAGFDMKTGQGTDGRIGLARHETQTLFDRVTGNHTRFVGELSSFESQEAFLNDLQKRMDQGNYVCVPLNIGELEARERALQHEDSLAHVQMDTMRYSGEFGYGYDSGNANPMEQWQEENNMLWQEAEAASTMSHLVEVSSINADGTISAYDPANKGFVTMSQEEFFAAFEAAREDHVGGTLGYYTTSTYLKPTYSPPTYCRPPTYTTGG